MVVTISVIIPTHNRSSLLCEAIQSVLAQTWAHFEIIVVDDASTDDTKAVIQEFDREKRICFVCNDVSVNAAAARNRGAKMARGEILSFLDDDDLYFPSKLEAVAKTFQEHKRAGVVITGFDTGSLQGHFSLNGNVRKQLTARFHTLPTSILSVRRRLFEKLGGFDESMTPSEDIEFCLRASLVTEFVSVPEPLVFHRQHSGPRLIDSLERAERSFARMLQKNLSDEKGKLLPEGRRLLNSWKGQGYAGLARRSFLEGDKQKARRYVRQALHCEPWMFKRWAQFFVYHFLPPGEWFPRVFTKKKVGL